MKAIKAKLKVHRNFKLPHDLNKKLIAESEKTKLTQTAILEAALKNLFAVKREKLTA